MPVVMVMGTECPSEDEKDWRNWYAGKTLPKMLEFGGIKKGALCSMKAPGVSIAQNRGERCAFSTPYLAIYEFESWEAVEAYKNSKVRADIVEDWTKNWAPRGAKILFQTFYETVETLEK